MYIFMHENEFSFKGQLVISPRLMMWCFQLSPTEINVNNVYAYHEGNEMPFILLSIWLTVTQCEINVKISICIWITWIRLRRQIWGKARPLDGSDLKVCLPLSFLLLLEDVTPLAVYHHALLPRLEGVPAWRCVPTDDALVRSRRHNNART